VSENTSTWRKPSIDADETCRAPHALQLLAGVWRVDLDESARRSGWKVGDRGELSMPVLFVAGKG